MGIKRDSDNLVNCNRIALGKFLFFGEEKSGKKVIQSNRV